MSERGAQPHIACIGGVTVEIIYTERLDRPMNETKFSLVILL